MYVNTWHQRHAALDICINICIYVYGIRPRVSLFFFLLRNAVQKSPRALVRCAGETWLPVGHKSCHMKAMNLAEAKGGWRLEALWPQPGHAVSKRRRRAVAATMFSAVYACTSHQSPLRCPQTSGVSPCSGATPTTDKLAAA